MSIPFILTLSGDVVAAVDQSTAMSVDSPHQNISPGADSPSRMSVDCAESDSNGALKAGESSLPYWVDWIQQPVLLRKIVIPAYGTYFFLFSVSFPACHYSFFSIFFNFFFRICMLNCVPVMLERFEHSMVNTKNL